LNDFDFFTDGIGGDTLTTIRDRLIALINADTITPATAVVFDADTFDLNADSLGGIVSLALVGSLSAGTVVDADDSVLVTEGSQSMLLNVQAFSKNKEPRNGAWAILQQCAAALQTPDLTEKFTRFGVGVWDKSQPVDLSAIAGASWETRASLDVTLAARALWVRPVDVVETVITTVDTTDAGGASIDSTQFTVNSP
jgi:hypothetical protein